MSIFEIASTNKINKVCIDGHIKDIRQYDKSSFNTIPKRWEIVRNTIYHVPILFCWN